MVKLKVELLWVQHPLDPSEGKPWDDLGDEDADVHWIYQIMQNNEDIVDRNNDG